MSKNCKLHIKRFQHSIAQYNAYYTFSVDTASFMTDHQVHEQQFREMLQISVKFNSNLTTKTKVVYLSLLEKVPYFFKNGSDENNFSSKKYHLLGPLNIIISVFSNTCIF